MNTADRELFQQALDALENSVDLVREDAYQAEKLYGNYPTRQGKVNGLKVLADDHEKAIAALRNRLAQPEQEPDPIGDAQDRLIAEIAAQSEQEPVAWGVFDGPNLHDMFFCEEAAKDMARLKGVSSVVRPLNTTPPAAQPEPAPGYCKQCKQYSIEEPLPAAAQPAMFGPMGTVGDLFDKHVIANGNLK